MLQLHEGEEVVVNSPSRTPLVQRRCLRNTADE